jgi:uncharacterized protein YggT (Ycf19 family)
MGLDRNEARYKKVVVRQDGDHVHEEHVVEDTNLEYRQVIYKVAQFVWFLFGILEALIGFRIVLKLIGANPANWFTSFVYQLTDFFLWPFQTIIVNPSIQGFVLEISSFIAMLVYALLAWAIVRLIWLVFYHRDTRRVTTYDREEL